VRLLAIVDDLKAELAWVDVGVGEDAVAGEVDDALGFLFLLDQRKSARSAKVRGAKGRGEREVNALLLT